MFKEENSDSYHIRSRLLVKNAIGSLGVKGGLMITSFLMVPLMINYISKEQYGIWVTLYSIIQWTSFFDIGLGNGLKNKLAISLAEGNWRKGKYYVSTTYFFMLCIFSVIGLLSFLLIPSIQWYSLFNISSKHQDVVVAVMRILVLSFSLQMIFNTLTNVIYAHQQNALSALLNLLSQVLSLLLVYILSLTSSPSLENIALVYGIVPIFIYLLSSYYLFSNNFKKVAPSFKFVKLEYAKDILSLGGNFFVIQFAFIVVYQTINVLISKISGPIYVTQYSIVYQYLSVPMMFFSILLSPLWPAITDAFARRDYMWMNDVYRKMMRIFFYSLLAICMMVFLSPYAYKLWVGESVLIEFPLTILVAIYMVMNIWNSFHSTILNGMGKVRMQLIFSILGMTLTIPIAICLGKYWGVYGILLSMIVLSLPTAIVSKIQVIILLDCTAKGIWNK